MSNQNLMDQEVILKDNNVLDVYYDVIRQNAHLFKNKTVLDLHCGLGLLSLFCAKFGGAKHIYAVDETNIVEQSRKIAEDNNFEDKITFYQGKVEEIKLPVDKVDIIICQSAFGPCLFHKSKVADVIYARDRWLAPKGLIFPDQAVLYLDAIADKEMFEEKVAYFEDVEGFDMSCVKSIVSQNAIQDICYANTMLNEEPAVLRKVDLFKLQKQDLSFTVPFDIHFTESDYCYGFVAHFDVIFTKSHKTYTISTSPESDPTRFKQTIFLFNELTELLPVSPGDNLSGTFTLDSDKSMVTITTNESTQKYLL